MIPIKPPTDNAYKFFCVLALLVVGGCFYNYWTLDAAMSAKASTVFDYQSEFMRMVRDQQIRLAVDNQDVVREIDDAYEQMSRRLEKMELSDEDVIFFLESLSVSFKPVILWRQRQDEQLVMLTELLDFLQQTNRQSDRAAKKVRLSIIGGVFSLFMFLLFAFLWVVRTQFPQDAMLRQSKVKDIHE